MNLKYPGTSIPAGQAFTQGGSPGMNFSGEMERRGLMISRTAIPFGHTSSHLPHVVQDHGKGESTISSIKSSSTCRRIRLILKFFTPVMGHAELQRPHCSQVLNISTCSNFFPSTVFLSIFTHSIRPSPGACAYGPTDNESAD